MEHQPLPPDGTTAPVPVDAAVRDYGLMTLVSPPDAPRRPPTTSNAAVQSLLTMRRQSWKSRQINKTVFRKAVTTGATTTVKTLFGGQMASYVGASAGLNMSAPVLAGFGLNAGVFSILTGGLLLTSGVGLALGMAIGGIYKFQDWKKQEEFNDALFQLMVNRAEREVIQDTSPA